MEKIDISNKKKDLKNIVNKFKSYKEFSDNKGHAYEYLKILDVKVCPYCNINYIYPVFNAEDNPVLRPDFDHFEPRSQFPEKELNVDNLIPSCLPCNRIKRSTKRLLHPFKDNFNSIKRFIINLNSSNYLEKKN